MQSLKKKKLKNVIQSVKKYIYIYIYNDRSTFNQKEIFKFNKKSPWLILSMNLLFEQEMRIKLKLILILKVIYVPSW
jgi:hypothetical protein